MKFNITKKGYDKAEVDNYTAQAEAALSEQKQRITHLKKQIHALEKELKTYEEKKDLISLALSHAVEKAEDIDRLSMQKYQQEIVRLRRFHDKWIEYYNKLLKKYPMDELKSAASFNKQMSKILKAFEEEEEDTLPAGADIAETVTQFERERQRIKSVKSKPDDAASFQPLERIKDYLNNTGNALSSTVGDSVSAEHAAEMDAAPKFSLEEALNPKEDLYHIMKDLGLIEEED